MRSGVGRLVTTTVSKLLCSSTDTSGMGRVGMDGVRGENGSLASAAASATTATAGAKAANGGKAVVLDMAGPLSEPFCNAFPKV